MKLDPLIQMPTAWTGVADRFGVHLFEGHVSVADMVRLEAIGDGWHRKHPGKLVELVVIYPSDSRMTEEERKRMSRLIKRWEGSRVASATVILAEGMTGAMHRSVLTGLLFLAPPPHPAKVFRAVRDSLRWLLPHVRSVCGEATSCDELLGAVDGFCESFRAR